MAEDTPTSPPATVRARSGKRKLKRSTTNSRKRSKPLPTYQGSAKAAAKVADTKKARRLIRKRIREYNSDEDEQDQESDDEAEDVSDEDDASDDEEDDVEVQEGVPKFSEGCRSFKMAFSKIMKKTALAEILGPVMSAHQKLVAKKLAEELAEKKSKGEMKKEKLLIAEKGHVKPASFLDSKEKFLISVATKGVVKLFNAVNKAQYAQKGLNPAREKELKAMQKQRKEAFLSELRRPITESSGDANSAKAKFKEETEEPNWAPLQDSFMLTNPKLKDWDKLPESSSVLGLHKTPLESSDEE